MEAIEFSEPENPMFESQSLFRLSFDNLKKLLQSKDQNLEVETDSLTFYKLGVDAYAPDADKDENFPVESVMVFEKGYYD